MKNSSFLPLIAFTIVLACADTMVKGAEQLKLAREWKQPKGIAIADSIATAPVLVVIAGDKNAVLWNLASGAAQNVFTASVSRGIACRISSDGSKIGILDFPEDDDAKIRIWQRTQPKDEWKVGATLSVVPWKDRLEVDTFAFSSDSDNAFAASGTGGSNNWLQSWDTETGRTTSLVDLRAFAAFGASCGTGGLVAVSTAPKGAVLFDTNSGEVFFLSAPLGVTSFSGDGKRLALVGTSGALKGEKPASIVVWDVESRTEVMKVELPISFAGTLALSKKGRLIAVGTSDGRVLVYETNSGKNVAVIERQSALRYVGFIENYTKLVTCCGTGSIKLWTIPETLLEK